ncbi:hypothetical protein NE237_017580 [Protea cynaroides]|uniref:Peptidase C1A papain C-terminal domain-containing protein n=1 Tax=Protea cynaroides TaxID=273540 RepID=A0A9Q0K8E3_9MAGN|nr:hypothetical protein NE237_017580 [Protea cynaroides]
MDLEPTVAEVYCSNYKKNMEVWYWNFLLVILFGLIVVSFLKLTPSKKHPRGEPSTIISVSTNPFGFQSRGSNLLRCKDAETGASATTKASNPRWNLVANLDNSSSLCTMSCLGIFNWSDHFFELSKFWISRDNPSWKTNSLSIQLIASKEIELIALLFEDGEEAKKTRGTVPVSSTMDMSIINYNNDHGMKSGSIFSVEVQGSCESCWASSTIAAGEGMNKQELVDCDILTLVFDGMTKRDSVSWNSMMFKPTPSLSTVIVNMYNMRGNLSFSLGEELESEGEMLSFVHAQVGFLLPFDLHLEEPINPFLQSENNGTI